MSKLSFFIVVSWVGVAALSATDLVPTNSNRGKVATQKARPRISHDDIAKRQRPKDPDVEKRTINLDDLKRLNLKKNPEQEAKAKKRRESLVNRSTIVSGAASWTILPKGAVLSTPDRFKTRLNGKRSGKLVTWREFYAANSSWIRLLPVKIEQATGEKPFTEEYLESLSRTGLLVVAICQGGPISVLQPKEGEEPPKVSTPVKAADWKAPSRR